MLKITAYGAAKEVGRSCILIEDNDRKVILDCGVKINHDSPTSPPEGIEDHIEDLTSVIISHAHLDHSGYVPGLFALDYQGEVHMTPPTIELVKVLWQDHLKIEGDRHFTEEHISIAEDHTVTNTYEDKFKIADGVTAKFYDAGHILGSAGILLDWDGTTLFYTGDQMNLPTNWHDPARLPTEEVDILITEATNALRPVPPRREVYTDLTRTCLRAIARKHKIIVPSFALGRSQELQVIIAEQLSEIAPTYVDGMILTMNKIYKRFFTPEWISPRILQWAAERAIPTPFEHSNLTPIRKRNGVSKEVIRREIMKESSPSIIITTSGMLEGGPIHSYLKYGGEDPNLLLALVGYQVEETIGRSILEGERDIILSGHNGLKTAIHLNAQVEMFNFSSHASPEGLQNQVTLLDPNRILIVHCQSESGEAYRDSLGPERNAHLLTRKESQIVN